MRKLSSASSRLTIKNADGTVSGAANTLRIGVGMLALAGGIATLSPAPAGQPITVEDTFAGNVLSTAWIAAPGRNLPTYAPGRIYSSDGSYRGMVLRDAVGDVTVQATLTSDGLILLRATDSGAAELLYNADASSLVLYVNGQFAVNYGVVASPAQVRAQVQGNVLTVRVGGAVLGSTYTLGSAGTSGVAVKNAGTVTSVSVTYPAPGELRQPPAALSGLLATGVAGQALTLELVSDSNGYSQDTTGTGTNPPGAVEGDTRPTPPQTRSSVPLAETLIARLADLGVTATIKLRAYPGDRTTEAVAYHLSPMAGVQLSMIQLSLNDVANYGGYGDGALSAEQTRSNLTQLIEARLRAGVVVVLCLPVLPADAAVARKVRLRNGVIRELAARYGLPVWDWEAMTAGVVPRHVDGVHHSTQVNAALATALAGQMAGQAAPVAAAGPALTYSPGTVVRPTGIGGPYDLPAGADWIGAVDQTVTVTRGQALVADLMLPASGASGIALVNQINPGSPYVFGNGYWLRRVDNNLQLLHVVNGGGFEVLGTAAVFSAGQDWRGMLRLELPVSGAGHTLRVLADGVQAFVTGPLTEWTTYSPGVVSGARMYVGGLSVVG